MTIQISDGLIYEGQTYAMSNELLRDYFIKFPERQPSTDVVSTALWRGYIATFEIKKDELFVVELDVMTGKELDTAPILEKAFPDGTKMDWYSGLIRIDEFGGYLDKEPRDGIFEFLEIYQGVLIQKRVMNYEELQRFKEEQYEYFLISDEVEAVYQLFEENNEGITRKRINEIIRGYILFYTKEVYVD